MTQGIGPKLPERLRKLKRDARQALEAADAASDATDAVVATVAAIVVRVSAVLEASAVGSVEELALTFGGGASMGASTPAVPVASARTIESVAVSFITTNIPGNWTLRLFKRSSTFPLTEVSTFTVSTS